MSDILPPVFCRSCRRELTADAQFCSRCGWDQSRRSAPPDDHPAAPPATKPSAAAAADSLVALRVLVLLLLLLSGGGLFYLPNFLSGAANPETGGISVAPGLSIPVAQGVVSKAEYDSLRDGMTYDDAVAVIGAQGTEQSSGHMDGVPGVMESITTKTYAWQNTDGSNALLIFQNNRMNTKAQFGLR